MTQELMENQNQNEDTVTPQQRISVLKWLLGVNVFLAVAAGALGYKDKNPAMGAAAGLPVMAAVVWGGLWRHERKLQKELEKTRD